MDETSITIKPTGSGSTEVTAQRTPGSSKSGTTLPEKQKSDSIQTSARSYIDPESLEEKKRAPTLGLYSTLIRENPTLGPSEREAAMAFVSDSAVGESLPSVLPPKSLPKALPEDLSPALRRSSQVDVDKAGSSVDSQQSPRSKPMLIPTGKPTDGDSGQKSSSTVTIASGSDVRAGTGVSGQSLVRQRSKSRSRDASPHRTVDLPEVGRHASSQGGVETAATGIASSINTVEDETSVVTKPSEPGASTDASGSGQEPFTSMTAFYHEPPPEPSSSLRPASATIAERTESSDFAPSADDLKTISAAKRRAAQVIALRTLENLPEQATRKAAYEATLPQWYWLRQAPTGTTYQILIGAIAGALESLISLEVPIVAIGSGLIGESQRGTAVGRVFNG